MSEISFEEDRGLAPQQLLPPSQPPFFVRLILMTGIVSTEKDAQYVLLGVAVICFLVAIVLFFAFPGAAQPLTSQQIQTITAHQKGAQAP